MEDQQKSLTPFFEKKSPPGCFFVDCCCSDGPWIRQARAKATTRRPKLTEEKEEESELLLTSLKKNWRKEANRLLKKKGEDTPTLTRTNKIWQISLWK
jgi:hypothetical protein